MRLLKWEACSNVRDMGGYATRDGKQIREGALIRSDNLYYLKPAGRAALLAYGVRTIIDLRDPDEIAERPHPFADGRSRDSVILYRKIRFSRDAADPQVEARFAEAKSLQENYCLSLDYGKQRLAQIASAIADAPDGAVVVHCQAGRDRTGIVSALMLDLAGVPRETIVDDYALSDTLIGPLNDEYAASLGTEAEREHFRHELRMVRQTMRGLLDHLDREYGGAEGYLRAAGLPEDKIERLKARLVENG